jgi:AmmeMemoRadiSam system protein B
VRHEAVAGRFYPARPAELRAQIQEFLAGAAPARKGESGPPKALIVPHAGYIFSGPIAASAYARLAPFRRQITQVVLVGPAHYLRFNGLAATSATTFRTPLGEVPVDVRAVMQAANLSGVKVLDAAHKPEHCLEVQLPFLQVVLDQFAIAPFLAGLESAETVSRLLDLLWGGPETLILISSDLSHYFNSVTARGHDFAAARAIEALAPEELAVFQACGCHPIRGLLTAARSHGLVSRTLDLRNSGDTGGTPDRVVGYGAFEFLPAVKA